MARCYGKRVPTPHRYHQQRTAESRTYCDVSNILFSTKKSAKDNRIRRLKVTNEFCRHVVDLHTDVETRSKTLKLDPCLFAQSIKLGSI